MRTTLTLDDEIARQLNRLAHSRESSFKATVNEVLKRGLSEMTAPSEPRAYRTRALHLGAVRGIDPARLGQSDDIAGDVHRMAGPDDSS